MDSPIRPRTALSLVVALLGAIAPTLGGTPDVERIEVPASAGRPQALVVTFERGGQPREIVLRRHSLRASGFAVRVQQADGSYASFEPGPTATYRGSVAGVPGSRVLAHLGSAGLHARVIGDGERPWAIRPTAGAGHEAYEPDETIERPLDCPHGVAPVVELPLVATSASTFASQHLSQIAFDVDYDYYLLKGSSVQNSVDAVEAIMNVVDFFYARDVLITYEITEILVRTSQFYFPTGGGSLLELFRDEWNTNQTHVVRDQAHLMTNKDDIEFGGLAYVGAVCNSSAYGWSLDSANIVGHELGHNWGSGHCHDLAPCNNMCGGCFFIAPQTKQIITTYRDSLSCLDDAGAYADPLPPYAHPDELVLDRDELALLVTESFDVLANDHDGNLDPLSIDDFDTVSQQGGGVSQAGGGSSELIYTPPGFVFPGQDHFSYTVADGTGNQQVGDVVIRVPGPRVIGYWPLDEGAGTQAADASNYGRHASTEGTPAWGPGVHGSALRFDGADDAAILPALQLRTNTLTLSAWVYRVGAQNPWAGLVFSRDENTIAGLSVGNAHELRYHWNGGEWPWDSGLVVPDQQWVFVALVVEPLQATIHLYDGSLSSAVHAVPHAVEEFDGLLKLGHDATDGTRRFRGVLDDVRILDHALSPAEITELAVLGGKAVAPNPVDGGHHVPLVGEASWLAGRSADSHDVYFGDDYVAVRDATPESPEFFGNRAQTSLPLSGIDPGQVHAWRVDQRVGGEVVEGDVWLFTRIPTGGHWPLDELGGPIAADVESGLNGSYMAGVVLGEPGAVPDSASAAYFDGVNDHVQLPALEVDAAELSITGWARRDGFQNDWAGLVFSRAGQTTAGISTRSGGDLRYHWNDAYWDWESGLTLPDDTWAFFALVVRSDMATIYTGSSGMLEAASNATLHGAEEFDGPLDLGRDGTGSRYFKGWLDDIRVWRTALSPRDVERIYALSLATAAGEVPDGGADVPLRIGKTGGSELQLSWSASCLVADADYGVYEGLLEDFVSHVDLICGTAGATSTTFTPGAGDRYYLVVPQSADSEGGYGQASSGTRRATGTSVCLPQKIAVCP